MRKKSKSGRWVLAIIAIAALAIVVWMVFKQDVPGETDPEETTGGTATDAPPGVVKNAGEGRKEDPSGKGPSKHPPPDTGETRTTALAASAAYDSGMAKLRAERLVEARSLLSKAYFSGLLPAARQDEARKTLTELAEITLIGLRSTVYPGDPYAFYYEFNPGEVLAKVERKLKMHVPWQIILKVNGLQRAADIQADRPYKMIYGPFHAIISKSAFTMDVYLQREGLDRIFIKRLRVGTGKNGSTPAGMWRIRLGGKHERATWYPPPNSPIRGPVYYGQPGYAFGQKGLWLSLEGLDENTRLLRDYGIHSTHDPRSIGRAESLGCIRLGDDDIELAYSLLYEHWSTVEVCP